MASDSSKEFLDIQATVECGFTLKLVRDMIKTYNQRQRKDKYSEHSSIIWPVWPNGWVFVYELSGCGFVSRCSHLIFRYDPASSKEFLDIQATVECRFTLKLVRDIIKTYSQMHRTDKYSQHSSIIWPVWPNGWVLFYELSGWGFESRCSNLIFRYGTCFEQGVPLHSGNCRVWIHSQTRTWHDKNTQSNAPYR